MPDTLISEPLACVASLRGCPSCPDQLSAITGMRNKGTILHWWHHETTVLSQVHKQILIDRPKDARKLIAFLDTVAPPPKEAEDDESDDGHAVEGLRTVDLGKLIARTAFFPGTGGSSSIKQVLPAVLRLSPYLKKLYGMPVYGTPSMPSLNFKSWQWLIQGKDGILDPYAMLDPRVVVDGRDPAALKNSGAKPPFIAHGGAAMAAYARLQQQDLSEEDRETLIYQLYRYCELDTLAMAMIYQAITVTCKI